MEDGGVAAYREVKKMRTNTWFRNAIQNAISRRRPARGLKARQVRFEPLETRALLSVSPAGGLDELGTDPAVTVLAASAEGAPSSSWVDSLTPQQAEVRDGLHGLLSRGGAIDELENFQPVLMPEAFLDELYDTYGVDAVWDSLGRGTMAGLFGSVLDTRRDTRVFPSDPQTGSDTSWVESLDPGQAGVRDELHALLSRGGTADELADFHAVLMPEAFLDELYSTYGIGTVWSSLSWTTLAGLVGPETLISRGDTLVVAFPAESPAALEYDAGQYADNGMPDYFELTRSGDNLILSIKEDTAPFDGQDLVTRATITLPIADVSQLKIKGSTDQDFFVISDLGDFAGLVSVVGVETDGLVDSVQIYDTAGDDVWTAAEDYGVFQMQNAYTVTATDVTVMHGYASAGGNDRAYLYGNEKTNKVKTFDNETNLVRLYLGGVYHRAKFFDSVEIDGRGGVDTAILYGTPSDDLFTATKDEGSFTSPHGGGIDYSYKGFELVTARGGSGRDRAELSDSELADEVRLRPSKAWMSERGTSTPAYAITLRGFESIHATALTDDGKVDIIKMHDSDAVPNPPVTNDLLTATMEDGRVRAKFYSNPANPLAPSAADQIYESLGFELTKGYSAAGSDKRATSGVDASLLAWDGLWAEI